MRVMRVMKSNNNNIVVRYIRKYEKIKRKTTQKRKRIL